MFTGIIADLGTVRLVSPRGDTRLEIGTGFDTASIALGASIACSGVCLTVIDKGPHWFAVTVSAETLSRTTIGDWREGTRANLERALKVGDELGGHIVSGHVDCVGTIASVTPDGSSRRFSIEAPDGFHRYVAEKGSIAVDGVSLTVNEVEGNRFGVNLIPHTLSVTTLGLVVPGERVNLEVDMLARYVARLLEKV